MICHCQGAYGAERLWEGSLKLNKTENCTWIKRRFVRKAGKLSGGVIKVPVYYIQSVAYEVAVISLKVVISLTKINTLFHIALCASQFRVWNRYHIMTPVYVSVIYFCIRSLVRHPPNTSIGCFRLALFGKPRPCCPAARLPSVPSDSRRCHMTHHFVRIRRSSRAALCNARDIPQTNSPRFTVRINDVLFIILHSVLIYLQ